MSSSAASPSPATPRPAAAVVPIRDGADGLEVLVAQRTPSARFMGGFWVFPGGRVEEDDPDDAHAAARELREETGVDVPPERLVALDRWITPVVLPIRFDTTFFLGPVTGDPAVTIDGEEIVAARWATPGGLLAESAAGGATLAFPTLRQLEELQGWTSVAEALAACADREPPATTPELELEGDAARLLIERGGVRRSYPATDVPVGERGPAGS